VIQCFRPIPCTLELTFPNRSRETSERIDVAQNFLVRADGSDRMGFSIKQALRH
jgi:hypothetical protein